MKIELNFYSSIVFIYSVSPSCGKQPCQYLGLSSPHLIITLNINKLKIKYFGVESNGISPKLKLKWLGCLKKVDLSALVLKSHSLKLSWLGS